MSTDTAYELLIGARGWEHAAWQGSFYPDDLPEDWRLSYYANEFQTVLVPESDWINAEVDVIEQWLDDTNENFVFYFEISLNSPQLQNSPSAINQRLSVFDSCSEQFGALIITIPIEHNIEVLPCVLKAVSTEHPVILNYLAPPDITANTTQDIDSSWHNSINNHDVKFRAKRQNVGFIDTAPSLSNKDLREQLEQYQSKTNPECPSALFLYGDPPDISNLRDIKMIKELIMG